MGRIRRVVRKLVPEPLRHPRRHLRGRRRRASTRPLPTVPFVPAVNLVPRMPTDTEPPSPDAESPSSDAPTATVTLADLEAVRQAIRPGSRPLLVNHWATWCESCVVELQHLVELHQRWSDKVDFLGISWDRFMPAGTPMDTVRRVREQCTAEDMGWTNLVFTGTPQALFGGLDLPAQTVPQTVLLGADGARIWGTEAPLQDEDVVALDRELTALLA